MPNPVMYTAGKPASSTSRAASGSNAPGRHDGLARLQQRPQPGRVPQVAWSACRSAWPGQPRRPPAAASPGRLRGPGPVASCGRGRAARLSHRSCGGTSACSGPGPWAPWTLPPSFPDCLRVVLRLLAALAVQRRAELPFRVVLGTLRSPRPQPRRLSCLRWPGNPRPRLPSLPHSPALPATLRSDARGGRPPGDGYLPSLGAPESHGATLTPCPQTSCVPGSGMVICGDG